MKNMQNLYHLDCIVCEAANTESEEYAKKCLDEANRETFLDAISEAVLSADKTEAFTRVYFYAKHYYNLREKHGMVVRPNAKESLLNYINKMMEREKVSLDEDLLAGLDVALRR